MGERGQSTVISPASTVTEASTGSIEKELLTWAGEVKDGLPEDGALVDLFLFVPDW